MKARPKSEEIFKKLCKAIPGGVNSPVRSCKAMNQTPMVIERAHKDQVVDVDGHSYTDFCGSWGALIHGHANPDILDAVQKRVYMGTTFGITSSIEEKMASKMVTMVDSLDKIRFVSSGTEATMSVARLARGYTSKNIIVKFDGNFHGHADFFLVKAGSGVLNLNRTSSSAGIPEEITKNTISLPFNDEKAVRECLLHSPHRDNIAAVILEPIPANMGVVIPTSQFLQTLRECTQEIGALLIFDEVITGFRVGLTGAQGMYGIRPDLSCFGKIIGGGFPAAAFGGRGEIMDHLAPIGSVYQAGTLSGNPVAMEAGLQALTLLEKPGFYDKLEQLTKIFTDPIEEYIQKNKINACLQKVGSMFTLFFGVRQVNNMVEAQKADGEMFAKYFRYMFANGVYIPPLQWEAWFVSSMHEEKNIRKARDLTLQFFIENML